MRSILDARFSGRPEGVEMALRLTINSSSLAITLCHIEAPFITGQRIKASLYELPLVKRIDQVRGT